MPKRNEAAGFSAAPANEKVLLAEVADAAVPDAVVPNENAGQEAVDDAGTGILANGDELTAPAGAPAEGVPPKLKMPGA